MAELTIGSFCTGFGGLDMAVETATGGRLAWYSEIEPAACTILEAHHPDVPNRGDLTVIDWSTVAPVDIFTAGYPCQPFSHAGKRKGTADERHLWPYIRDAIGALRPRLVVLENVRGHLSLGLADVIGDLAALGYDARWCVVRASDAGAPHGRARVFIAAHPRGGSLAGLAVADHGLLIAAERSGRVATDSEGSRWGAWKGPAEAATGRGFAGVSDGSGPLAPDSDSSGIETRIRRPGTGDARRSLDSGSTNIEWGKYGPAIRRWESITRPAPAPTVLDPKTGRSRLSPRFVEWMQGLDDGHVTGHGLSNTQELKALGNGVVPQQAMLALRMLGVAALERVP